jgi:ribosomal protein L32
MVSAFRLKFQTRPERLGLLARLPDLDRFSCRQHLLNSCSHFDRIGSPTKKHKRRQSKKRLAERLQRQVSIVPQKHTSQETDKRRRRCENKLTFEHFGHRIRLTA